MCVTDDVRICFIFLVIFVVFVLILNKAGEPLKSSIIITSSAYVAAGVLYFFVWIVMNVGK